MPRQPIAITLPPTAWSAPWAGAALLAGYPSFAGPQFLTWYPLRFLGSATMALSFQLISCKLQRIRPRPRSDGLSAGGHGLWSHLWEQRIHARPSRACEHDLWGSLVAPYSMVDACFEQGAIDLGVGRGRSGIVGEFQSTDTARRRVSDGFLLGEPTSPLASVVSGSVNEINSTLCLRRARTISSCSN